MQFKLDDNYYSKFVGFCPLNEKRWMKNTDIRFILSFLFYGELHKKQPCGPSAGFGGKADRYGGII